MRSSFPLFLLLVFTLGGCATSPSTPPVTDGNEPRATALGVAQLNGRIPFVFCDQCPERTPKQLSLPTPIAPIVARTVPETPAIKRTQRWALHFSLGSSRLGTASRVMLNEVVSALNAHPLLRISIQGHTDLVGAQRFNKRLASGRARAVRDALLALGIPGARIEPLAANCCIEHPPITNPSARRVDVLIKPMGNQYDK